MRSRPRIVVRYESTFVVPGVPFRVHVELHSESETPVDFVDVTLIGQERLSPDGLPREFWRTVHRDDAKMLSRGVRRISASFILPPEAPDSITSGPVSVRYAIDVHVSIPWWPDRQEQYSLRVVSAAGDIPAPVARLFANKTDGRGPQIEVSLATQTVAAGATLRGAFAVSNRVGLGEAAVSFVQKVTNRSGSSEEQVLSVTRFNAARGDATSIDFELQIPSSATRSFWCRDYEIAHRINVATDWEGGLGIPLQIFPLASRDLAEAGAVIHPVGRARRSLVWNEVARDAQLETGADYETMLGRRGSVTFSVCVETRKGGSVILTEMRWPTLGIDLRIDHADWLQRFAGSRREIDTPEDPLLSRRFDVFGRIDEQVRACVREDLLHALSRFDEVEVHDDGCRLAVVGSAQEVASLARTVRAIMQAAEVFALMEARVPPPNEFITSLPAWQRYAESVGGRLERGRMCIHDGEVGLSRLSVETVWVDNKPHATAVRVGVSPALPLTIQGAGLDSPHLSPAARSLMTEIASRGSNLEVTADDLRIELELVTDPTSATWWIDSLVELARLLQNPANTPFR